MNIQMTIPTAAKDRILAVAGYGSGTDEQRVKRFILETTTKKQVLAIEAFEDARAAKENRSELNLT